MSAGNQPNKPVPSPDMFDCQGFDPNQVKVIAQWLGEFCEMTDEMLDATRAVRVQEAVNLLKRLEAA